MASSSPAPEPKQSFNDFFAEGMSNLSKAAFPQLSAFMDFSKEKQKDEDRSSGSANDAEENLRTPNGKRSGGNSIANEMVLDSLGAIDERLKVQGIVLVSQLEQQTQQTQLLQRLASSGMGGGSGGAFGGAGGGGILKTAEEMAAQSPCT